MCRADDTGFGTMLTLTHDQRLLVSAGWAYYGPGMFGTEPGQDAEGVGQGWLADEILPQVTV